MYAAGGTTNIENIMVLCKKCHASIRGEEEVIVPSEDEYNDENNE